MRTSQFFFTTLKEAPSDAEVISQKMMLRAGYIKRTAAGIYTWMPLGLRVLRKVEKIVREEMNHAGAPLLISPRQGSPRTAPAGSGPEGAASTGELRVPVLLSASRTGPGVEPGVDLNASGELAALFKRARESGTVAVSGRMELAQAGGAAIHVVYAALPLYATGESQRAVAAGASGKRPDPLGFVIGIYNIEKMIHVAISLLVPRCVEVLVRD